MPRKSLIFPNNADFIVSEILQKYNLEENDDDFFDKIEKGEETNGEIVAELAIKTLEENLSFNEFIVELKTEFSLSRGMAEKMAKNLKEKLIDLAVLSETTEAEPVKAEPNAVNPTEDTYPMEKPSKEKVKDSYREPLK